MVCCAVLCPPAEDEQELQEAEYRQALGEWGLVLLLLLLLLLLLACLSCLSCLSCQHCCVLCVLCVLSPSQRPLEATAAAGAAVLPLVSLSQLLLPSQPRQGRQQQQQQQMMLRHSCCSCFRQPSRMRSCCRSWCAWQSSTGLSRYVSRGEAWAATVETDL
jgi:hypothetical protein